MLLQSKITIFLLFILLLVCISLFSPLYMLSYVAFSALAISAEHSFWLHHYLFPSNVKQAAKLYIKSSAAISVSQQIQTAFQHKSSEISNISEATSSEYISHIVLSLSDIICNNFLGMSPATFYSV